MKGKLIDERGTLVDRQVVFVVSPYKDEPNPQFVFDDKIYETKNYTGRYWQTDSDSIEIYEWIEDVPSKDIQITALMLENAMLKSELQGLKDLVANVTARDRGCPSDRGYKDENCSYHASCDACWINILKMGGK